MRLKILLQPSPNERESIKIFYFLILEYMKKIFIWSVILTSIILTSCTNPFASQTSQWWEWKWWRGWQKTDDIVRLKGHGWNKWWQRFWSWARSWSGSRMFGSGGLFSTLSEEDKQLLRDSMTARRSGDTAKADEIIKWLKEKYPLVFSWSVMMIWGRWNRGWSGSWIWNNWN